MKAMSTSTKADMPFVGFICVFIGWLSFGLGGLMLLFAFSMMGNPPWDIGSLFAIIFALMFSSVGWFAIGRMLAFLAQIERNTTRHEDYSMLAFLAQIARNTSRHEDSPSSPPPLPTRTT
jgi:hypothetical protein